MSYGRPRPSTPLALRAFEAAARNLSFRVAAEELGLTQSAISHQVRGAGAAFRRPPVRPCRPPYRPERAGPPAVSSGARRLRSPDPGRRPATPLPHDRRSAGPGLRHRGGALADPAPAPLPVRQPQRRGAHQHQPLRLGVRRGHRRPRPHLHTLAQPARGRPTTCCSRRCCSRSARPAWRRAALACASRST